MTSQKNICELPKNIEHYLATLSKHYAQEGKQQLQEVIVNAQIRVHEQWSFDNWNGGTYGHALYLILPEILFLRLVKQKDTVEDQIQKDRQGGCIEPPGARAFFDCPVKNACHYQGQYVK